MHIRKIQLTNFRCFRELTLEFHPEFTLLAGGNGAGKTTVLRALKWACSSIIEALGVSAVSASGLSPRSDVRRERVIAGDSVRFEPKFPVLIQVEGELAGQHLHWRSREDGPGWIPLNEEGDESDAAWWKLFEGFHSRIHTENPVTLPIFAYYPAGRTWSEVDRETLDWQQVMATKPQRFDAYANCLNAATSLTQFLSWFTRQQMISLQRGVDSLEFRLVKHAVLSAFEGATSLVHDVAEGEIIMGFDDGTFRRVRDLSDGQLNLVAMFGDIAMRAVQLNDFLGERALQETPGVVLIDELDLHLHPRWQRNVVHDLRRTFPKIQFIVASHSPQILGELAPEEIILLGPEGPRNPEESFGRDSNYILREVMDAPARNEETTKELDRIRELIQNERYDDALHSIGELRQKIGADPELERAEALVHRITLVGT